MRVSCVSGMLELGKYCAEGIKSEIISDHRPFLHTFFLYGSASAQLAETQRPDPLHKTYVKTGDDLKD